MQNRTGMQVGMLTRVEGVLWKHPELASVANSPAGGAIHAMIAQLKAQAVLQDSGARESRGTTASQRKELRRLRVQMRAVSGAARLKLRESEDFVKFTMPARKTGAEQTLAAAQAMSEAAKHHEAALRGAGLKPDCVTELDAAAAAVRTALAARSGHRGTRRNATASIQAASSDVQSLLRVLDGMVLPLVETIPGLLAEWKSAKRIGYKPGGSRTPASPTVANVPLAIEKTDEHKEAIAPAA